MGWNHLAIVWPWLEPDVAAEAKVWFWRGHDTSGRGLGKCSCFESWTTLQDANDAHVQYVLRTSSRWPTLFFFWNLSRTCQSTWRSSQSLVWLALHLDMLAMRCQHSGSPWIQWVGGRSIWQEGGQLTEPVRRRPYCVLLFDEMEQLGRKTGRKAAEYAYVVENIWNINEYQYCIY